APGQPSAMRVDWSEERATPEMIAAGEAGMAATDADEQAAAMQERQRLLHGQSPYIALAFNSGTVVAPPDVAGPVYAPADCPVYLRAGAPQCRRRDRHGHARRPLAHGPRSGAAGAAGACPARVGAARVPPPAGGRDGRAAGRRHARLVPAHPGGPGRHDDGDPVRAGAPGPRGGRGLPRPLGPRRAAARAVPRLHAQPAAGRPRGLAADRPARARRPAHLRAGHAGDRAAGDAAVAGARARDRPLRRRPARPVRRPRGARRHPRGALDAAVLARARGPLRLLLPARAVAVRRAAVHVDRAAREGDRLGRRRRRPRGTLGRGLGRGAAHRAAGARAHRAHGRDARAVRALGDARGARRRLRARRPRQGPAHLAGADGARAARRARPGHHRLGPRLRRPAVRHRARRADLQLARRRPVRLPLGERPRPAPRGQRLPVRRDRLHRRQPARRPRLRAHRPPDPAVMSATARETVPDAVTPAEPATPGSPVADPAADRLLARRRWPQRLRLARVHSIWRQPAVVVAVGILAVWVALALLAPVLTADPIAQSPDLYRPPSAAHRFGTGELGGDVFARVVHGARLSLPLAVVIVGGSLAVGGLVGLLAGYLGRAADEILMRLSDLVFAFPQIIPAMAVAA